MCESLCLPDEQHVGTLGKAQVQLLAPRIWLSHGLSCCDCVADKQHRGKGAQFTGSVLDAAEVGTGGSKGAHA